MARLGVIDLGSNSVRLVVYETKREDAAKPFRTLVDEKKMAGLAAYVTDGALSNAGIARAVAVLGDLLKLADNLNCARVDIFATAVLRNCANSEAATAAIEAAIDHKVRVLSAREEAHLGFVGASIGAPLAAGTLIDVGGGSTELTALAADGDHAGISIPFGCVLALRELRALRHSHPGRMPHHRRRVPQRTPGAAEFGGVPKRAALRQSADRCAPSRRWSPPCGATTPGPRASAARTWKGSPISFRATSPFSPIAP